MSFLTESFASLPGIDAIRENIEAAITWGPWEYNRAFIVPAIITGAARDLGASPTTLLRPGLLMGRITATKLYKSYDPLTPAIDGSAVLSGVLLWDVNTQKIGSDESRWFGYILVGGLVKAKSIILDKAASTVGGWIGGANEATVRNAMQLGASGGGGGRFILDDWNG